jgi:muramoyltetrapeptide carboxypeptidase
MDKQKSLLPPACEIGDRVAIIAPSGPFRPEYLHAGCELLRSWGLEPVYESEILEQWGYLAGHDQCRANTLLKAFLDPSIRAVLCARGGYGAVRLLSSMPWAELAKHPKRFFGFSDITILHNALRKNLGWITFHAPMIASPLLLEGTAESIERLKLALFAETLTEICPPIPGTTLRPGCARGQLVGGNLALIASTIGTPYQLDLCNAILFLEDIGEAPYRLDRLFQQLHLAGMLEQVAGLALGDFGGPLQDDYTHYEAASFWLERLPLPFHCPILYNLPVGHIRNNWTLALGAEVILDADLGTLSIFNYSR